LQDLFSEWQRYREGGGAHCIDCHMPQLSGDRAAEAALIPFEQDRAAPPRVLRSHRFVGPDFPLDDTRVRDETRAERASLLARAATLEIEAGSLATQAGVLRARVRVTNVGTGHNLPGGFAFIRQMWVELQAFDASGAVLASSGAVNRVSDDLCDPELLAADAPLRTFVAGCSQADSLLVNFQQKLVDRVELARDAGGNVKRDARGQPQLAPSSGGKEVIVQHLSGGAVARVRSFDALPVPPLEPGEARSFDYTLPLGPNRSVSTVRARLLFRALPPYFLRALASQQTAEDGNRVDAYVENLEIVEMTRARAALTR
jgi:hypothetical protein